MTSAIILISIFIGYGASVAFFVYKYTNSRWQDKYKSHIIKGIRKARLKRNEIESLNDDELWERASRFMR